MFYDARMSILATKGWEDYALLDSGDSMRLEKFGKFVVSKPDPQAIWKKSLSESDWQSADAVYKENEWSKRITKFPENWIVNYKDYKFLAKLSPFKHTGIFPEQVLNWQYIEEKLKNLDYQPKVLNLFAYTGAASIVAAKNGAFVTHLDASKSSISWAKENQNLSEVDKNSIRWILDDAIEFTAREARRGVLYDGIIMDPPIYGHGPNKELWDFDKSMPLLLENCSKILTKTPLFVILNAYAISASSVMLKNLLEDYLKASNIEYGELALEQKNNRLLSTGIFARFSAL